MGMTMTQKILAAHAGLDNVKAISAGDKLEVDFSTVLIKNLTKNESYQGGAFPPFMQKK